VLGLDPTLLDFQFPRFPDFEFPNFHAPPPAAPAPDKLSDPNLTLSHASRPKTKYVERSPCCDMHDMQLGIGA
jgi:hypothetical protein